VRPKRPDRLSAGDYHIVEKARDLYGGNLDLGGVDEDDLQASSSDKVPDGEELGDNELELGSIEVTAGLELVQKDSMLAAI
jgi:hypothetical protein